MQIYVILALAAVGWWGVSSGVKEAKKINHKVAHVVAKPFHHKKATEKK